MDHFNFDGRQIGPDFMPFFVAEACNNHGGSLEIAKKMMQAAYAVGANAVKYQLRFGHGYLKKPEYEDLYLSSKAMDISVFFTVFDEEGMELVQHMSPPAVKIGSAEWTNFPFVKKVLSLGLPTIVSTGGGDYEQVDTLAQILKSAPNECMMLHCTSIYPCPAMYANLALIPRYKYFALPVGFSDHTTGIHIALAAIALGACLVEKHFTIDPRIGGPDQHISVMPRKLQELIEKGDSVWRACLPTRKIYLKEEREKLAKFRDKSAS